MRYLAVAHFGRGRGEFVSGVAPAHWQEAVQKALERRKASFDAVLAGPVTAAALLPLITSSAQEVLLYLYPDVSHVFE
jgi:hypothetical protein